MPSDEAAIAQRALRDYREAPNDLGQARSALDLRYILAAVRANLVLIGLIIAVAVGIAVIATVLDTPRYIARATIQINDSVERVLKDQDDSAASDMSGWDTDRNIKTQIEILQSKGLALRVARKLNLAANPQFWASQGLPPPPQMSADAGVAAAAGVLQPHLKVEFPRDSRIVGVTYESADPRMAALLANTFVSEFIQANLQRKFDSSAYARNFVAEQLAETKKRVEDSERALNDYARNAGIIRLRDPGAGTEGKSGGSSGGSGGGASVSASSLVQLNTAANEATSRRIIAEGRWRALSGKPLLSSPEVLANGTVATLLAQKAQAEAELQQERARHLEGYPTVQAKAAQVAALDRQIQHAAELVRRSVYAEYQATAAAEASLAQQVGLLKGQTLTEQDRTVQYSLLAREADTNRQVYDGLLQRYKELNASAGISLSNISVVDPAEVPGGPSSPNLMKNLVMALLIGVGLAAVIVFVKDQFDDAIRVPEDVETKLGLSLLGVIPRSHRDEPEDSLADPKSPISESYNSLRGSLLYSTSEGLPQVMLFTSAQSSEGKTTSSFAVASGLARMGKRVLLIDADLRRPSLHRRIDYSNERGLSTLLTSADDLASAIQRSGVDGLDLLTSGAIPPSPTELLSSPRFERLVQDAAMAYDVIIIDSPPVLGLADAPAMAAIADGVVFIVEAGRNRRGALKTALRRLRAVRPVLLGAVLTKFDTAKAGNRYSEYYGYEYYQYEQTTK